jgi:hypothetical protein
MKKYLIAIFALLTLSSTMAPSIALADWMYGTATFKGTQPSKSLNHGSVIFYYNGTLKQTMLQGNTEIWECTGDVCVIFPKNYSGRAIVVNANGSVQMQYLR